MGKVRIDEIERCVADVQRGEFDDVIFEYGFRVLEESVEYARRRELGCLHDLIRLRDEAEDREVAQAEAAYERQLSDYYGGDGPVTVREQLAAARRTA